MNLVKENRYLEGKHAVVTGGSRGIGAAIAASLANRGARLTIMGRTLDTLEHRAAAMTRDSGAQVQAMQCDVTDDKGVQAAFARARTAFGPVDVLVNNAGGAEAALFAEISRALWDRMLAVNLTGTFVCTAEVLPAMLQMRSGRIVNIASMAGLRGFKTMVAYSAAKHGVVGFTRSLALETARHGVTVNAVCPGYTDTDLTNTGVANLVRALGKTPEEARAMLVRTVPRGKLIEPDEVASAVDWLCSPQAAAVTGIALPIAGGEGA
ncbi:MAG TPA: SDR family NAD(P)-dependent oxidoreductase [Gemmatimonadaceae bacterium]|nr:SDR family NAD(P)-dependent oxidoreductase [Gemmatimonadaceae bacterium]